ncbi:MAG TPA: hypothetical protein VH184_07210 [Dongiaceae bacterium]|jgi:hypothetical protein|nr:hypothetical protein [Dongiaceae bacterium]
MVDARLTEIEARLAGIEERFGILEAKMARLGLAPMPDVDWEAEAEGMRRAMREVGDLFKRIH